MMKNLDLKLGYSCNNDCIHCVITDYKNELLKNSNKIDKTTDEIFDIINNTDFDYITLTGGEPTIRPDLIDIISFLCEKNKKISMQTNGRAFSKEEFCDKILKYEFDVIIAIHGPNKKIHDAITQRNNSFDETILGIKNLINNNKIVIGKIVISKLNMNYLFKTVKFAYNLGIKELNIAFPHALGAAKTNFDIVVPKYSDLKGEIKKIISFCDEKKYNVQFEAIPNCILGRGNEKFSSDNLEMLMSKRNQTIVNANKEHDDWDILKNDNRMKFPKCKNCVYDLICPGPWKEYPNKFGNDEFEPL